MVSLAFSVVMSVLSSIWGVGDQLLNVTAGVRAGDATGRAHTTSGDTDMTLDEIIEALGGLGEEERLARIESLIGEVSEDDLAALRDAAIEAAQAYIEEVPTEESAIARAEALTVILDAIDRRTGDTETDAEADAEEAADIDEAAAAAASADVVAPERDLVAADGAPADQNASTHMPIPLNRAAAAAPAPTASDSGRTDRVTHTVLAAGDLPNYRAGQELTDSKAIAAAVHTGMSLVSRSQAPGVRQALASIKRKAPDNLFYQNDADWVKVDAATDQRNLPGQSLTAAGGWCAPSEVMYDTCPIPVSRDGMIDLPTITANRGGIKYSQRPDFTAFWSLVGFEQTETDAMAGVEKPCFEIPCPDDLSECRMDIEGICLIQPLLTERGWPEKVEEFVEYALLAHAHRINARRIARMVDMATYAITVPGPTRTPEAGLATAYTVDDHGPGAFESLLSVLELQVEYFRYSMRLARNALLEGMAPYWLRGLLRADISKKLGIDNRWGAGTDAALDRWFADRGVRIQWVYDWQDSMSEQDPTAFGGTPPTKWPEEVSILLWEPGAYFALQQDVINLTGVYDRVDLQRNVYTRLFTEEGFAVCQRCGRSMLITIPLCPNGLSGSHELTICSPATPPVPAP